MPGGRKPKPINDAQLKALMRLKPSLEDTAAFFEVHRDTICDYIKRHYDCSFPTFRNENMVHTRFELVRTAIEKAKKGDNVMLIFCLKNLCGWKDKWDNTPEEDSEQQKYKSMSTEELIKLVKNKTA